MRSLDWLAALSAEDLDKPLDDWDRELRLRLGLAIDQRHRTTQRNDFLKHHAINADRRGTGPARSMAASGWDWLLAAGLGPVADVTLGLEHLLSGSARILLQFELLQPALSRESDSLNLFDNSLRKDALFRVPHLGPQTMKGLAADAYQRAFPSEAWPEPRNWRELGATDPERTRTYRRTDRFAARMFGTASDTRTGYDAGGDSAGPDRATAGPVGRLVDTEGRLHFSPVWCRDVQFVIMNPGDPSTARGRDPIQFETIAPGQIAVVDFVYHNPRGLPESDLVDVRSDLARLLWALAHWWPELGLGAKRLAGYGGIRPAGATFAGFDWPGSSTDILEKDFERSESSPWLDLAKWLAEGFDEH